MAVFAICASAQVTKSGDSRPIGTKAKTQPKVVKTGSVGSPNIIKSRTSTFVATAYCLTGKTALGTQARRGIVAVDPEYITLGTYIYVEGFGRLRAEDTGRLIKGARLDIWLPCKQAIKWGRRPVKLRIISTPIRK